MKLGVYFFITFLVLYGVINVHYAMPEFAIVMALIPAALVQISLSVYFARKENKIGMALLIVRNPPTHPCSSADIVSASFLCRCRLSLEQTCGHVWRRTPLEHFAQGRDDPVCSGSLDFRFHNPRHGHTGLDQLWSRLEAGLPEARGSPKTSGRGHLSS